MIMLLSANAFRQDDKLAVNARSYFLFRKLAFSYLGYYLFLIKSSYTLLLTINFREKKYVLIA